MYLFCCSVSCPIAWPNTSYTHILTHPTPPYPKVVPLLLKCMADPSARVQAHAASASLNFCQHLDTETMAVYTPALMTQIATLLQQGATVAVQEAAVGALSSIADTMKEEFAPYYPHFVPALKMLLLQGLDEGYRGLRGRSMECLSLIMQGLGKKAVGDDVVELMNIVLASPEFKELAASPSKADPKSSYYLVYTMGRLLGLAPDAMEQHLKVIMPVIVECVRMPIIVEVDPLDDNIPVNERIEVEGATYAIRSDTADFHHAAVVLVQMLWHTSEAPLLAQSMPEIVESLLEQKEFVDKIEIMKCLGSAGVYCCGRDGRRFLPRIFDLLLDEDFLESLTQDHMSAYLNQWVDIFRELERHNAPPLPEQFLIRVLTVAKVMVDGAIEVRRIVCFGKTFSPVF